MATWATLAVVLILGLASFVQSALGFGFGLVAMALLPSVTDVRSASVVVGLSSTVTIMINLFTVWRHVQWRKLVILLIGLPLGTTLGVVFLAKAPADLLIRSLGVVVLYAAAQDWFAGSLKRRLPVWAGFPVGVLAGAVGGAFSISGAVLVAYGLMMGWSKHEFKANLQALFTAACLFRLPALLAFGLITRPVLVDFGFGLILVMAGVVVGIKVFNRLPKRQFRIALRVLLMVVGLNLLVFGENPPWRRAGREPAAEPSHSAAESARERFTPSDAAPGTRSR